MSSPCIDVDDAGVASRAISFDSDTTTAPTSTSGLRKALFVFCVASHFVHIMGFHTMPLEGQEIHGPELGNSYFSEKEVGGQDSGTAPQQEPTSARVLGKAANANGTNALTGTGFDCTLQWVQALTHMQVQPGGVGEGILFSTPLPDHVRIVQPAYAASSATIQAQPAKIA
eukprot:CAMPEP_0119333252 /NCGR_PEP_ID=MMETSP1333-20130426/84702_1 /TAXON_ID=418940 /ORGANISM="Scyphosphaera apsteinii, Strain RCC1455" /LENGTH=170 /DNA_ID=CAMNT_0007343263 /DNA_START=56 /DNA_END=570 /DNA_ORIENTATION=+